MRTWRCRWSSPAGAMPSNWPKLPLKGSAWAIASATIRRSSRAASSSGGPGRAPFLTRPKRPLAAEPTGNLDGTTGKQVMDLLFELARADGATLILITHDMALAARCDRILRIADR